MGRFIWNQTKSLENPSFAFSEASSGQKVGEMRLVILGSPKLWMCITLWIWSGLNIWPTNIIRHFVRHLPWWHPQRFLLLPCSPLASWPGHILPLYTEISVCYFGYMMPNNSFRNHKEISCIPLLVVVSVSREIINKCQSVRPTDSHTCLTKPPPCLTDEVVCYE